MCSVKYPHSSHKAQQQVASSGFWARYPNALQFPYSPLRCAVSSAQPVSLSADLDAGMKGEVWGSEMDQDHEETGTDLGQLWMWRPSDTLGWLEHQERAWKRRKI